MTVRVVVVRPWVDGRGGGGCCGGDVRDGIAPPPLARDDGPVRRSAHDHEHADATTDVYRRLRRDHPDVDTQVTPANNMWLVGWAFTRVRTRRGAVRAGAAATVAMRPGAVLVDGVAVAHIEDGGEAVSSAVERALTDSSI